MPSPASLRMSATTIWLCGTSRDHRCITGSGSVPSCRPRAVRVSQLSLSGWAVGGVVAASAIASTDPFAYSARHSSGASPFGSSSGGNSISSSPDGASIPFSSANTLESNVVPDSSSGSIPPHSYPPHSVSIESASERAGHIDRVVADGDCTIEQRCD
uniref:Uncharacterized protein n=1 Tax=Anopheles christyi TaxID=43041 RepID=A0A182KJ52_9DIPT